MTGNIIYLLDISFQVLGGNNFDILLRIREATRLLDFFRSCISHEGFDCHTDNESYCLKKTHSL
jgi:hypothetical protein